jgi:hypothetical protein
MPPHGSHKKKNKKKDKKGKRGSAGPSRGVGGGSAIDALIESGNEHLACERIEEGLRDLKRARDLSPDSADAAEAYGMALAEYGDAEEAISVLKRAAQVRLGFPRDPPPPQERSRVRPLPPLVRVASRVVSSRSPLTSRVIPRSRFSPRISCARTRGTRNSCTSANSWTTASPRRRARAKAWR